MAEAAGTADARLHLYQARLRDLRDHHLALLDPNEMERRSQFTNRDDRDRFTRGAVLLRLAVASLTGCDASTVPVSRTCDACGRQHGRPRLPGTRLHASVSHSSELVVVAATPAGPVGVDVEKIGGPPSRRLLSTVCTAEEQAFVLTPKDFYTLWVRKEAILKATGDGMRRRMTDVLVTPPNRSPSLVFLDEDSTPPCSMAAIDVDGYAGAVAVMAHQPTCFTSSTSACSTARAAHGPSRADCSMINRTAVGPVRHTDSTRNSASRPNNILAGSDNTRRGRLT